jgi:hypothetical protein
MSEDFSPVESDEATAWWSGLCGTDAYKVLLAARRGFSATKRTK